MFWFIARKGRMAGGPTKTIRLVDSLTVGQNRFIGIFEIAGRFFLYGVTEQNISPLGELEAEDVKVLYRQGEDLNAPNFHQYFGSKMRQIKREE